jgi:hypothetical protein
MDRTLLPLFLFFSLGLMIVASHCFPLLVGVTSLALSSLPFATVSPDMIDTRWRRVGDTAVASIVLPTGAGITCHDEEQSRNTDHALPQQIGRKRHYQEMQRWRRAA